MIFEYDNIVIGSSLSALAFAYINDYPVFFTNPDVPFRFDYLAPNYTAINMAAESKVLNSFSSQIYVIRLGMTVCRWCAQTNIQKYLKLHLTTVIILEIKMQSAL